VSANMGGANTKLHKAVELDLLKKTRFDGYELRQWYTQFHHEYPSGMITKQLFIQENIAYTGINDKEVWEHVFDLIDVDKNGSITFVEWICLLSCVNRGSHAEQLKLLFHTFDLDNNGSLSQDEVTRLILLLSKVKTLAKSPAEIANEMFSTLDVDKDGKISFKEFHDGMVRYPSIRSSLNFLGDIFKGFKEAADDRSCDGASSPRGQHHTNIGIAKEHGETTSVNNP